MSHEPLTPEEQGAKERAKSALTDALAAVENPQQADAVVTDLEARAAGAKEVEVARQTPTPADANEAASAIETAASAPAEKKPQHVIAETARQIAASDEPEQRVIAEAVREAVNPEATAAQPVLVQQRRWLRDSLLKRLDPANGTDVRIFLAINQLPHTRLLNDLMYAVTRLMTGGHLWMLGLTLHALTRRKRRERRYALKALVDSVPSLLIATTIVDYPIKRYFRRRRPFINVVRAIVVGRKPGSYSFPSGHSASAFGGAYLLSRYYPKRAPLFYAIAALVGFSRIYVGAHYPGDVLSGSGLGILFAAVLRHLFSRIRVPFD